MEEYDAHEINTDVRQGAYERERQQQTDELGPNRDKPTSPTNSVHIVPVNEDDVDSKPEEEEVESTRQS